MTNLEKKFGQFTAVNRVNFTVNKGEIFGFLGPNGAGKSTTIRMLCGIIPPSSGGGQVGGYNIIKEQRKIKQNIGYMSQKFSLYDDLTVEENINFYSGIYRISDQEKAARKAWVIKMAGLNDLRKSRTSILSGGWKQRLALGCAILHKPKIVFLDEPTSGVDPISRRDFWILIKEMARNGVTVFVTTHYMDEAENCNRIALIYKGNIIALNSPDQLKTDSMQEDVLELLIDNPEDWIELLTKKEFIKELALFGNALHAVVDKAESSIPLIREYLEEEKINNYNLKKITPSLEDVFVSLIETHDKKRKW